MTTATRLKLTQAIAALPTFAVSTAIAPETKALILEILEESYTDGITDLVSAELTATGEIVGEFIDRVGLRSVKRFRYRITDEEKEYFLLNPGEVEGFAIADIEADTYAAKKKKGKRKAPKCTKGVRCGNSCQPAKNRDGSPRNCTKKNSPQAQQKVKAAQQQLASGGSGNPQSGVAGPGAGVPTTVPPNVPTSLASASPEIQAIAAGIETGDIDSMVAAVDQIYDAGKAQAVTDGVHFYGSIRGGNGTTDPLMTTVLTEAGFNKPPIQGTKGNLDKLDPKQNLFIYRNPSQNNFKKRFDQFKNADGTDYTAGRGIYCSGTYVAANYLGTKTNGKAALAAAQDYGNGTMRMVLNRTTAKIGKQSDISREQANFEGKLDSWFQNKRSQLKPDPQLEQDALIQLNSNKVSVTKNMQISKRLSIYNIDSVDPTTNARITLKGNLWKDTSSSKPWRVSGYGKGSPDFKTRKDAINWAKAEEAKNRAIDDKVLKRQYRRIKAVTFGDDRNQMSGRFAVLRGYDFVNLDRAYDPTYGLLLNRSAVLVQKTKASSTTP